MEIWLAAPQVAAHRMTRMMWGGWPPSPADQREYLRMVQEKGEAVMEAWAAALAAWPRGFAAVAGAGLKPVHTRVTANRRRLARGRR